MSTELLAGIISFVHHDKEYVTIDYTHNGKKKTINGKVDEARQLKMKEEKLIRKVHRFHEGDEVFFVAERSPRGDKQVAEQIRYRFNNTLGNLVNRARSRNYFTGYLKVVDEDYFVKETGSYQFFPLRLSPWELPPDGKQLNEPVDFQLENLDKPEKLSASLVRPRYIPQYLAAEKHYRNKTTLNASVHKITAHGIYLNLIGDKLQAKLPAANAGELKAGDKIKVLITYLSPLKIAVVRATPEGPLQAAP